LYLRTSLGESPEYLYSKGLFVELEECLSAIAKHNGVYSRSTIQSIISKLKVAKFKEEETGQS